MTDKFNKNIKSTKPINAESEFDELEIVPLILPDDFNTPPDLDERILREMSELREKLDRKNRE